MRGTVFYSWQADTDKKVCRFMIGDALKETLKDLSQPLDFDESTRGEPGSPDIFGTVLKKIAKASFFVVDLTIVGSYSETKSTPNPNVLIEYGYALGQQHLGPERIISVLNDHFGIPEKLPFDLKARAMRIRYSLSPEAGNDERKDVARRLRGRLRSELQLAIDHSLWLDISKNSRLAVELFVAESENGAFGEPSFNFSDFCARLALSNSEARAVVDELEGLGLIDRTKALFGDSPLRISPRNGLFWKFDHIFKEWNVEQDALRIAEKLLSGPHPERNHLVSVKLAKEFGWPPRRINPALTFLAENNHVHSTKTGAYPYAVESVMETANTRRFVKERRG